VPLDEPADGGGVSRAVRAGEAGTFFVSKEDARDLGDGAGALFTALDCKGLAALAVPLKNVQGSAVGVLCLLRRSEQDDAANVADSERVASGLDRDWPATWSRITPASTYVPAT